MAGPTTARRGGKKSSPSGPRSARRPGKQRRPSGAPVRSRLPKRRTVVLAAVLGLLLAGAGVWALYGSSWLRARYVTVSGVRTLTEHEVVGAAAVPMDTPLVSVNKEAIAARLRSQLPRVKKVDVARVWPHTIGLKVTERVPELLIQTGGKFVEVDDEGVRFATVSTAPKGVPLLEMDVRDAPDPRRFGGDRLRREAVRACAALPKAVHQDLRVVKLRSYDSITLELAGDRTVVWGSGERSAAKAKVLGALLKAAGDARHFDVSVPSAPAVSGS
ncbi:FtsQ-type POTRA domain-containing protein [Streptomyces sp. MST-110588]|uniref:cell division protein FtsQ/DivIB n=1 Tax=Streptomyces sp. MST-110588 TaxID=2833628 RepID=UPI001F5CA743|nr:FtsQ-type POTRA domain-containing protein [Streptomyces sp. MST-110588]UNO42586.1 FtsQ-type POTRA domain-containing protein [Streptomyces sp. MST-110588]